jgi:hypothetical protein
MIDFETHFQLSGQRATVKGNGRSFGNQQETLAIRLLCEPFEELKAESRRPGAKCDRRLGLFAPAYCPDLRQLRHKPYSSILWPVNANPCFFAISRWRDSMRSSANSTIFPQDSQIK